MIDFVFNYIFIRFIFQASHVFELLATGRAELRLRDLMFVFKPWKKSISNAEIIHQDEENKLRLSTEHPQLYYMSDIVLQSGRLLIISINRTAKKKKKTSKPLNSSRIVSF